MYGCGVSNKIEIWVDIIFRCVTKYYLPFFPNHLNMMKRFNSPTVQKQETSWIWPMGHSLLTAGLTDEHVTLRGQSPAMRLIHEHWEGLCGSSFWSRFPWLSSFPRGEILWEYENHSTENQSQAEPAKDGERKTEPQRLHLSLSSSDAC